MYMWSYAHWSGDKRLCIRYICMYIWNIYIIYICIYIYVCSYEIFILNTYVYIYIYVCSYEIFILNTYVYLYICMFIWKCLYYIHMYIYIYVCSYEIFILNTYVYIYICMFIWNIYIKHICIYIHVYQVDICMYTFICLSKLLLSINSHVYLFYFIFISYFSHLADP
jgi:hypothetical protein